MCDRPSSLTHISQSQQFITPKALFILITLAISILALPCIAIYYLRAIGFITRDAAVLAASLALAGVILSAGLTFFGTLIKTTIDLRSQQLQTAAEHRLALEAATKALAQLSTTSGSSTSVNQQSGTLALLASLGQVDVALALLRQMWSDNSVSDSTAMWLIDRGLFSASQRTRHEALDILLTNIDRAFRKDGSLLWPSYMKYGMHLPSDAYTRRRVLHATVALLLSRPFEFWAPQSLHFGLYLLFEILSSEASTSDLRCDCAYAITSMAHAIGFCDGAITVLSTRIDYKQLANAVDRSLTGNADVRMQPSSTFLPCLEQLDKWGRMELHRILRLSRPDGALEYSLNDRTIKPNARLEMYNGSGWTCGCLQWEAATSSQLIFVSQDGRRNHIRPSDAYLRLPDSHFHW